MCKQRKINTCLSTNPPISDVMLHRRTPLAAISNLAANGILFQILQVDEFERMHVGRLQIYADPRDAWVGAYLARDALYVCPVPFAVLRWTRGKDG